MIIYGINPLDGSPVELLDAPVLDSAVYHRGLAGETYIQLVFTLPERIALDKGCFVRYTDGDPSLGLYTYELMANAYPEYLPPEDGWRYTLRFESQASHMKHYAVVNKVDQLIEISFVDTTTLEGWAEHLASSMNLHNLGLRWAGRADFSGTLTPEEEQSRLLTHKSLAFKGEKVWDAAVRVAETFGCEWWTEQDGQLITVCFGKLQKGSEIQMREGEIITTLPARKGDDADFGTRFYVFGSTRNLDPKSYPRPESGVANHVGELRLRLPNGRTHIDARPNLPRKDVVEQVVFFDEIYPHNTQTITGFDKDKKVKVDGEDYPSPYMICAQTRFMPGDMTVDAMQAEFLTGALSGQIFKIKIKDEYCSGNEEANEDFDKKFWLVPNVETLAGAKIVSPSGAMWPKEGDQFVLKNVLLPKQSIADAEVRLETEAELWVKEHSTDTDVYSCKTDPIYCAANDINLPLGQRVCLIDDSRFAPEGRASRIQEFEKDLLNPYKATYTVGDNVAYSRLGAIETSVQRSRFDVLPSTQGGRGVYLIQSKYDLTVPSDSNAYSAAAAETLFLNKQRGGTVKGSVRFDKDVAAAGDVVSTDFRQGGFGGAGFGIYKDANDARVLEIDKILVRRGLEVNEFVVNQVSHTAGRQFFSAAGMEVVSVVETTDAYRCHMDTKQGQIVNHFVAGDQGYCQQYQSSDDQVAKYYWRLVTAVGEGWIDLSKTDCDGDGVPEPGDVIAQIGHRTDANRQSAYEIDQTAGGAVVQYAGVNSFSFEGRNCIGQYYDPADREAKFYAYGEAYVGDRDPNIPGANYLAYMRREGESRKRLHISGQVHIGDGSSGLKNLSDWSEAQQQIDQAAAAARSANEIAGAVQTDVASLRDQLDGQVECWFRDYNPTPQNAPASEWTDELKKQLHQGDTFTNLISGESWRWVKSSGNWLWEQMDAASARALASASASQAALDGRCAVFLRTPLDTDVYAIGDLWLNATYGGSYHNELLHAVTAKAAGASFDIAHWAPATKYTDNTAVDVLRNEVALSVAEFEQAFEQINADDVLCTSEKQNLRTLWENINGISGFEHPETVTTGSYARVLKAAEAITPSTRMHAFRLAGGEQFYVQKP